MKKIIYLLTILFAVVLMNISCEKKDDSILEDVGLISRAELNGLWNFQKFQYAGIPDIIPITTCEEISNPQTNPTTAGMRWIKLSLNINAIGCDLIDACDSPSIDGNVLTLDEVNNKITLDNGLVWEIISYNKVNEVLVLKLISPNSSPYVLVPATYTLKKE